jgi:hypothetical protein
VTLYFGQISFYYILFFIIVFFSGRNISVVLTSGPFLLSGRDFIFRVNTPLLYSALYYCFLSPGRDTSVALASGPFLPSGRDFIFRANTLLLYSVLYYCLFSLGRDISTAPASGPLLPSGCDFIFRANTPLLYSAFYYCPFSSGYSPLVILASRFFSRVASILLFLVANLSFRAAFYCGLVFQLLLVTITILVVRTYPASAKRLK